MTTETTEEHIAEQLPFDETAPEPDTKAGGRFIVAILVLVIILVVTWGLLALLYSATMAENRDEAADFRLNQVNTANAEFLDEYREYQPADDETKVYQVPVSQAQQILLANPEYLAHMPGTTLNTAVPGSEVQLPVPPSLPQDTVTPESETDEQSTDEDAAAAPGDNDGQAADDEPSNQ